MPLNKLDNFLKNTEGRILYVSPADIDATDSILNTGNSLARPFKTIQRALIEAARFSYVKGSSNDDVEKTTILLMPGEHIVDNRPGWTIFDDGGTAKIKRPNSGSAELIPSDFALSLDSNFDLTQEQNHLYRFNSVNGGVIVPRGTSIVGLDLRKTKVRPKYIPNPTDSTVPYSAIFRITGACYFWQFSIFDGDEFGLVYTKNDNFDTINRSSPTFSHHKLTCFEYADGVNEVLSYGLTDLQMYYAKLSRAYNTGSGRDIDDKFPGEPDGFSAKRPEYEIVGAFADDPIKITRIEAGEGGVVTNIVTVTTNIPHGLNEGTPIRISGVGDSYYNVSTKVSEVDTDNPNIFYYNLSDTNNGLISTNQGVLIDGDEFVTVETDTVTGASPYIFNCSLRSVWGMNGMHADGSKATGFRSMVVAQFTGVSLQKDDRAFVKYNSTSRNYSDNIPIILENGTKLSQNSSSPSTVYHLDADAIYRSGWETTHIKVSNDAFIQIVSVFAIGFNKHFAAESGGDASITNSNSNFGQISLASDGFKREAFDKDNKAFITHIIPPRAISGDQQEIDWLSIDIDKTQTINNSSRLYITGFSSEDTPPPILTQGYKIGAKALDKLFVRIGGVEYSADILMSDGNTSSIKEYSVDVPSSNTFTISGAGSHTLSTGEKVIITSDNGNLPENLETNTVYYAIVPNANTVKLAASENDANNDDPITVNGGSSLKIKSRVSDKNSGDIGSPIQWDNTPSGQQWYIITNSLSQIFTNLSGTGGTEPTYIRRIEDSRGLDEKIYKLRVVVPKELQNAKTPENGFVIQESSSTGVRGTDGSDFTLSGITTSEYDYNRNPRFISTCSFSNPTATVVTELPHNLTEGDTIIIRNVTDSLINTGVGTFNSGYNGTFEVSSILSDMSFTYDISNQTPGTFTNNTGIRTDTLPRFERRDLKSNLYIYRNEVIQEYVDGQQDGIYHLYILNADNSVSEEFTSIKYGQNVVDLYPQLDKDNVNDNPESSRTYAKVSPLGEVVTNDLKKSITKETIDKLSKKIGFGLEISSVADATTTTPDITFTRAHGLQGIVEASVSNAGSGLPNGHFSNVKLLNNGTSTWDGATANIFVSGGSVGVVTISSPGSGYNDGEVLDLDGFSGAEVTISASGISTVIGNVVQFTGAGNTSDTYHRISAVSATNQISIARTTGDPVITSNHYAYVVGPSLPFTSSSSGGLTTINASGHGLAKGNRIRIVDSSNNNQGDYLIANRVGVNTFTIQADLGVTSGFILKHGLSSNGESSNVNGENIGSRGVPVYAKEELLLGETIGKDDYQFKVTVPNSGIGTMRRFPLGSYIQVDSEIMRVSESTLQGASNDKLRVIRGSLGTRIQTHDSGTLIRKVNPISIEFRRPSIIRASGHTFEYLGYGPGNYSTGLPQVQTKSLPEKEEFLVQAQERSAGIAVYTGMNNRGDFYIGNQKKSSATGEETTFDTPVPTITGGEPSRLSGVFDEITVKERIVVEGGDSGLILSQFDGPVTFNGEVRNTNRVKITNETDSSSITSGSLIVNGGIGVGKTIVASNIKVGTVHLKSSANEITATTGNLQLNAPAGQVVAIQTNTTITGILSVTDDITAFWSSDERLKDNITHIDDPLSKVLSISGNTFDWNEKSNKSGHDVGLIAQEIEKVLPEAVVTRDNGYLAVDYHKVVPLLVEAIKELSGKVELLEQKLEDK